MPYHDALAYFVGFFFFRSGTGTGAGTEEKWTKTDETNEREEVVTTTAGSVAPSSTVSKHHTATNNATTMTEHSTPHQTQSEVSPLSSSVNATVELGSKTLVLDFH